MEEEHSERLPIVDNHPHAPPSPTDGKLLRQDGNIVDNELDDSSSKNQQLAHIPPTVAPWRLSDQHEGQERDTQLGSFVEEPIVAPGAVHVYPTRVGTVLRDISTTTAITTSPPLSQTRSSEYGDPLHHVDAVRVGAENENTLPPLAAAETLHDSASSNLPHERRRFWIGIGALFVIGASILAMVTLAVLLIPQCSSSPALFVASPGPTASPTASLSLPPTATIGPSQGPTLSATPTLTPTGAPSVGPTLSTNPTGTPTVKPSQSPTLSTRPTLSRPCLYYQLQDHLRVHLCPHFLRKLHLFLQLLPSGPQVTLLEGGKWDAQTTQMSFFLENLNGTIPSETNDTTHKSASLW